MKRIAIQLEFWDGKGAAQVKQSDTVACDECGQPGFTLSGLRRHRGNTRCKRTANQNQAVGL